MDESPEVRSRVDVPLALSDTEVEVTASATERRTANHQVTDV